MLGKRRKEFSCLLLPWEQGQYLQRKLVHGMDGMEVIHGEVQQRGLCGCRPVVLPCLINLGFRHLWLLDLEGKHRAKLWWKHPCTLSEYAEQGKVVIFHKDTRSRSGQLACGLCSPEHGASGSSHLLLANTFLWYILHLSAFILTLSSPLLPQAPPPEFSLQFLLFTNWNYFHHQWASPANCPLPCKSLITQGWTVSASLETVSPKAENCYYLMAICCLSSPASNAPLPGWSGVSTAAVMYMVKILLADTSLF